MKEYKIRRARISDLDGIMSLERLAFPKAPYDIRFWKRLLRESDCWVCERGEEISGSFAADFDDCERSLHILTMAVHPDCRKRGLGSRFMNFLEIWGRRKGCALIFLEVRTGNEVAIRLYRRSGYEFCSLISQYYPDGDDALLMVKFFDGRTLELTPAEKV